MNRTLCFSGEGLHRTRAGGCFLSRWLGHLALWAGIGLLALLAIPAALLFWVIGRLWSGLDWLTARLHQRGEM